MRVSSQFSFFLPLGSEIAPTSSRLLQSCPCPFFTSISPPQVCSYPIRSLYSALGLLTKSVPPPGEASQNRPFPLALPIARLAPAPFDSAPLKPPIRTLCPALCLPSPPIPPFGKRGLVSRSSSGSRRSGRGVEAEVAAPGPGVGRSRGCSRSGAAASRGAGAAAAPYCGPQRPRPSHGRDLR